MRSTILCLLASAAAVIANGELAGIFVHQCAADCIPKVDLKGCGVGDKSCICKADLTVQAPLLKCAIDSCNNTNVSPDFNMYANACKEFNDPPMTDVPKLAFFEVPTRTPAAQFSLPECGNKCINNQNFRGCSALDPACVCKAAGIDPVSAYRCILDTCNPTDAAVSMLEFAAQCGMTENAQVSLPLPFKALTGQTAQKLPLTSGAVRYQVPGVALLAAMTAIRLLI